MLESNVTIVELHGTELKFNSEKFTMNANQVWISGRLKDEFEYRYGIHENKFYQNKIEVARETGKIDSIPIVVSKKILLDIFNGEELKDKYVEICGHFRSRNIVDAEGRNHVDLYLFVRDIKLQSEEGEISEENKNSNCIFLEGCVCRPPIRRQITRGNHIVEIMVAVNRDYGKADYIPCIIWGKTGLFAERNLNVGDKVKIHGRVVSRKYPKKLSEEPKEVEVRETYEVSVAQLEKIED